MSPDDLARWLVAQPWWRWRPGMTWRRDRPGGQALSSQQGMYGGQHTGETEPVGCVPDLTDPAIGGVLLEVLRERHGRVWECSYLAVDGDGVWYIILPGSSGGLRRCEAPTLAHACALALHALEAP